MGGRAAKPSSLPHSCNGQDPGGGTKAPSHSPQPNNKLFDDAASCSLPCTFSRQRVAFNNIPFGKIQHDPESFRYVQLGRSGLSYLFVSNRPLGRALDHLAKSPYQVTDAFRATSESILALCRAPYCEVLMATSHPQQAEWQAALAQ
jgi:hypothetical protein